MTGETSTWDPPVARQEPPLPEDLHGQEERLGRFGDELTRNCQYWRKRITELARSTGRRTTYTEMYRLRWQLRTVLEQARRVTSPRAVSKGVADARVGKHGVALTRIARQKRTGLR